MHTKYQLPIMMFLFLSKPQQLYAAFFGMVESVADLALRRRWHSQPTWEFHIRMCVQTNHIMACVVCTYIYVYIMKFTNCTQNINYL